VLIQYQRKPVSLKDEKACEFFKRGVLPKKKEAVAGLLLEIAIQTDYLRVSVETTSLAILASIMSVRLV